METRPGFNMREAGYNG